jgi:hypothetical protein
MEKLASDFGSGAHPQGKIPIPNPGKNLFYILVVYLLTTYSQVSIKRAARLTTYIYM